MHRKPRAGTPLGHGAAPSGGESGYCSGLDPGEGSAEGRSRAERWENKVSNVFFGPVSMRAPVTPGSGLTHRGSPEEGHSYEDVEVAGGHGMGALL